MIEFSDKLNKILFLISKPKVFRKEYRYPSQNKLIKFIKNDKYILFNIAFQSLRDDDKSIEIILIFKRCNILKQAKVIYRC